MRQSEIYASKRLSMNLQYVVLSIGLRESMLFLDQQLQGGVYFENHDQYLESLPAEIKTGPYFKFATYFVDNKENLKDIMS